MSSLILPFIQAQVTRYGMSTLMVLGNIGNSLIVILFYRRRQNSCAMYLLCVARYLFLCKFRYYISHIWNQIGRYLAILACVNRFFWTINYAHARFMSRPATSRYIIGIVILFWFILPIHAAVLITVNNGSCGAFGVYYIIYRVYSAIFLGLLPPILMSVFGFLAYHNMKRLHARIRPIGKNADNYITTNRRDRELLIKVFAEVAVYVMTAIPYTFILLEVALTNYMGINKSIECLRIESFLTSVALTLVFLTCSSRFYTYFAVSKVFRKDFKKLFSKWTRPTGQQVNVTGALRTRQLII